MNDIVASGQSPAEQAALAGELLGAIGTLRRVVRRTARQAWTDQPLPPTQSELLRLAAAQPGISVADAAHELRLAPNTVSTLVGRLTTAGLLDRTRATSDGRSVRLTVTERAQQRLASWRDVRAEVAGAAIDRLPDPDRETLAAAVPALLHLAAVLEDPALADPATEPDPQRGRGDGPLRLRRHACEDIEQRECRKKVTAAAPQQSRTRTGAPRA